MKTFNRRTFRSFMNPKNKHKFRIARIMLYKYLRDWRNKTNELNCFYWATIGQLKTLNYLLQKDRTSFGFDSDEVEFLCNIRDAKELKYGKYYWKF